MALTHRACTIVAHNYVAQARVLARSVQDHSPETAFSTLLIDGTEADRDLEGVGEVVLPADLGLDARTLHSMQLIYDVMEYATALKPAMLMMLLRRKTRTATYLDPDIRLYADIDDLQRASETSGMALTPHTLEPLPRDGRMLDESVIMHAGIYNLGFVSTSPQAYRFLAWWHNRLTTDAVVDLQNALFTDQRWMDWAPAVATPAILRDKGLNAAYWNLHERTISGSREAGWTVDGGPLRFFHFSGFDPATPELLSKHQGAAPRNLLSEKSALRELCQDYAEELTAAGHIELRKAKYRHDLLPSGLRLTRPIRRLCRDSLLGEEPALGVPPDPWTDEQGFRSWLLDEPIGNPQAPISRFELGLWRLRHDLRGAFPDPLMASATDLRAWLDSSPEVPTYRASAGLSDHVRTSATASGPTRAHRLGGWSVVGYARAELGVGEAGRRVARVLGASGIPWEMVGLTTGHLSRQDHSYRGRLREAPGYDNQILCVNADQTHKTSALLGPRRPGGRRIGFWFWELEDFPQRYHHALDDVDEVWVSSEFNRAAVAAVTDKPVAIVPLPALPRADALRYSREQLGLPPGKFVFLVNFDYLSVSARKNPIGAIEAYRRAFDPDGDTVLVVKSINGVKRLIDRERVRFAAAGRSDILLREDYMTSTQIHALSASVDCVVSLHRSEGFGLNLLDAMSAGTPVVATGYSGNMQFMDAESAFLVPFTMTDVGPGAEPYDATSRWAEPDLDTAAEMLVRVARDDSAREAVVAAAHRRVAALAPHQVAQQVRRLLIPELNHRATPEHQR